MDRQSLGLFAEQLASQYLQNKGYVIKDHNFRKPWGEIDIVAEKSGIAIFVEVKANARVQVGFEPELRADWSKMRKVARTARTYLAYKQYAPEQEWQIDIISIVFNQQTHTADIKHYKNVDV